jgi:hypothetical protein
MGRGKRSWRLWIAFCLQATYRPHLLQLKIHRHMDDLCYYKCMAYEVKCELLP